MQPSGSTYVFLKAFLKANGMTLDDIKQSTVNPPYENYLLLGRVDAVPGYLDAEVPELEAKAGGPGSLSIMQGSDYGYVVYGSGLFTSEKMIAEQSDLVQRFVNAYTQAFADVIKNPDEAADLTIKENPEYAQKKDVLVAQLDSRHQAYVLRPGHQGARDRLDDRGQVAEDGRDPGRPGRHEADDRCVEGLQRQVHRRRQAAEAIRRQKKKERRHDPHPRPPDLG